MALRTIRIQGDPVLTKVCRPIPEVTDRIRTLAEDMLETMYEANGVGLAAPQVGILKRMVVIDIGDGQGPFIMINPEIIESDGEQTGDEGCLSLPGKAGQVIYMKAPEYATLVACKDLVERKIKNNSAFSNVSVQFDFNPTSGF